MRLAMRRALGELPLALAAVVQQHVEALGRVGRVGTALAQATWPEPGPWQASQETFSADKVVW